MEASEQFIITKIDNVTFIIRLIFTSLSFCGMTIEVVIVFPRNKTKNNPDKTGTYKYIKALI